MIANIGLVFIDVPKCAADSLRMIFGYARNVTAGPSLEEQISKLKRAGCSHIFIETDARRRTQLALAMQAVAFGDVLAVFSLQHLARSLNDLAHLYRKTGENGSCIIAISEPFTDAATEEGRQFAGFMAWLVAFDAISRHALMDEGRNLAKQQGRLRVGKPSKFSKAEWAAIRQAYRNGDTCENIAKRHGVATSTISRHIAKHEAAN